MRAFWFGIIVALFGLGPSSAAHGGAYTLPAGEAKLFVSGLLSSGDRYFDRHGRLKFRSQLKKYDLQFYGEYGFSDAVTLFGSSTLEKIAILGEERSRRSGLGRSEFGARVRLLRRGPWIVAAQTSAVIAGAKAREGPAAIGETDDQVDIRGLVARSFSAFGRPGFVDVQVGYRTRSGDPADEIRLDATLGWRVRPRLLLLAQSFNTFGQEQWKGAFPLRQRIHKLQLATFYDLTPEFSIYSAAFVTPDARDALDERGAIIGVGYRF